MLKSAKINSIFLGIVLVVGTFVAVYPSFIIGNNIIFLKVRKVNLIHIYNLKNDCIKNCK
jgi:hypothetical protein